ncbi:MAG: pirin family protein [Chromatiales bacterium]|nr:pirin family protein [Chromatiales bacterium]
MLDTTKVQRPVIDVVDSVKTLEGGGFPVRRPFPTERLMQVDPFLLLDHLGPVTWGPGQGIGAPDHPHRGFETVTYLLSGGFQHKDSAGHAGKLSPGDVQWMTAGSGVVHSELPSDEFMRDGGVMHGFQIWVNLPARDKMMKPRYQEIPAARIPQATSADGRVNGEGDRRQRARRVGRDRDPHADPLPALHHPAGRRASPSQCRPVTTHWST